MELWNTAIRDPISRWVGWRWVVHVSVAATALVVMSDIGELLAAVQGSDARSFGTQVFTGGMLRFWETAELDAAFELWRGVELPAAMWVQLHAVVDFFFIAGYGALLWKALGHVREPMADGAGADLMPLILVGIPVVADLLETGAVLHMACTGLEHPAIYLGLLQFLSLTKWVGLVLLLATIVALFFNPAVEGDTAFASVLEGVADEVPLAALTGLWVLIALFGALVAIPAGGPLEQLPDIIRAQFSDPARLAGAGIAFFLLLGAVVIGGWRATSPIGERRPAPGSLSIVLGTLLVTGSLAEVARRANGQVTLSPLAPLVVVLAITIVAWTKQRTTSVVPAPPPEAPRWWRVRNWLATWSTWGPSLRDWLAAYGARWSLGLREWFQSLWGWLTTLAAPRPPLPPNETTPAVAGMAAMVVLIGSLGLVRAAIRPALLEPESLALTFLATGVVAACGGPVLAAVVVPRLHGRRHTLPVRAMQAVVAVLLLALYLLFLVDHDIVPRFATNGVVAITFGVFALAVGELTFRSRNREVWWASQELGLGLRSPLLGLAVVSWLLIGVMETTGGYHEVREAGDIAATAGEGQAAHTSLARAHRTFQTGTVADRNCLGAEGRVPMLLVAAPGGGIRAAYWTASVLEELESLSPCGRRNVFAVSAVSGGSVGAAVWLTTPPGTSPSGQAALLGQDDALARTVAALLTRDLLQPVTGIRARWADRAGVQSRAWIENTRNAADTQPGARLDLAWPPENNTAEDGWVPVVVMNAASVTDGCRVLVSNVGGLAASPDGCVDGPKTTAQPGPVTASLPAFSPSPNTACDDATPTPSTALATLTSARFPLVSPSGAIRQCLPDGNGVRTIYAVDGGYFENSGLMTLLQLWAEIQDTVDLTKVEPWIVLADNSYRSDSAAAPPARPREFLVPLRTRGASQLLSSPGLEQMARSALPSSEGPAFVRIGPSRRPSVTAPLGWVLSDASLTSLCQQLVDALAATEERSDWDRLAKALQSEHGTLPQGTEERRNCLAPAAESPT